MQFSTYLHRQLRSCLAQSEDYVLACYHYIELNPVRTKMVNHPRIMFRATQNFRRRLHKHWDSE
ncbi:MAG TPA: hypothetical protein ENK04_13525 [Gammaproteobacteria bacterium]|nr:hypothetical protein [Gammaproteobacteria bacterium]